MTTRAEICSRFGATAEAAQWFEFELGDLLYTAKALELGLDHTPDADKASALFADLERDTTGKLLGKVKQRFNLPPHSTRRLTAALKARNMLIHRFFIVHREELKTEAGCRAAMSMLDNFDTSLREARDEVRWITLGAIKMIVERRGNTAMGSQP